MSTDVWRLLAIIFFVAAVVLIVATIVLYRVLRIHEVRRILSGKAQSEEIEEMRHSRWGTWGETNARETTSARRARQRADMSPSIAVRDITGGSYDSSALTFSRADMDEGETTLASSKNVQLSSTVTTMDDDEGETTLARSSADNSRITFVDDEGETTLAKPAR